MCRCVFVSECVVSRHKFMSVLPFGVWRCALCGVLPCVPRVALCGVLWSDDGSCVELFLVVVSCIALCCVALGCVALPVCV